MVFRNPERKPLGFCLSISEGLKGLKHLKMATFSVPRFRIRKKHAKTGLFSFRSQLIASVSAVLRGKNDFFHERIFFLKRIKNIFHFFYAA
jgi:hypothetical protein